MRIISGKYRGRKLISPKGDSVRPTSDMVKESIFNVIQFGIAGARFLDLFAGSGNVGIEALSRGASQVYFVDNNRQSVQLIEQNTQGFSDDFKIISKDYVDALMSVDGQFDYIFVDAPYAKDCISQIVDIVFSRNLLTDNGYIIYEHDNRFDYILSLKWYIKKSKRFGGINVDYISKTNKVCAFTGSFDPITLGHMNIIDQALNDYDKVEIIIGNNQNKEGLFDLATREKIARLCLKDYVNVNVDVCDGLIYKLCNHLEIDVIVRGIRNDSDLEYESPIAQFNLENGGIRTVYYTSDSGFENISSSQVKIQLKNQGSLKNLLPTGTHKKVIDLYKLIG